MSSKGVEQKPSETAFINALRRALAYKEYANDQLGPDNLAEWFLPPHFRLFLRFEAIRQRSKKKLHAAFPGVQEYVIARTGYFDKIFSDALKKNIPQIVVLGAGYDSRAYRFAGLSEATSIFELDIATTQDRKSQCLEKAGVVVSDNVALVPINFNTESVKSVLESAGFASHKETLFLWEGVSYYLIPAAVDAVLEFVGHSSSGDSSILFDYAASLSEEDFEDCYGIPEFVQSMKKHHPAEVFKTTINESEIESYLEQRGLKLVRHMDIDEIEKTCLLDEKGSLIGSPMGLFRFVIAAPGGS